MMIAVQPPVEVVTAGNDWAAIAAAIATGVAAIIGIAGTARQARRAREVATMDLNKSIGAATANQQANIEAAAKNLRDRNYFEGKQALRAEKMRVYSEFQGAIDNLLVEGGVNDKGQAIAAIYRSAAAVTLIAPGDIGTLAHSLAREIGKMREKAFVQAIGRHDKINVDRDDLYRLMRADLGTDQA